MPEKDRHTQVLAAVLVLGALGVAAAFFKTMGGFDGIMGIARSLLARLDQLIR
jgi:hypothetical protein